MNLQENAMGYDLRVPKLPVGMASSLANSQSDQIDVRGILALFRRRLWLFARIVALSLSLAVLITFNIPASFTATADVEMRTIPPSSTTAQSEGQTADDPGGVRIDAVDTELQVIKSRALAAKVLDQLDLEHDQAFIKNALAKSGITAILRRMVFINPGLKKGWDNPVERRDLLLDYMLTKIDAIRIVTTAYAVHIKYSDGDPIRAARIANGYANAYAADQATTKQADNGNAIASLHNRIEQLRAQAEQDFASEQRYRIENGLLSTNATSLTEQEVSSYNQQVAAARAEAAHDRSTYDNARRQLMSGRGAAGEAQVSAVVGSLSAQRAEISAKVADLSSRFLDGYPDLMAARQQLRDIDGQIDAEIRRTLQLLDAKANASERRLASLTQSQGSANGKLSRNNNALILLDGLHRRSQTSQATYDTYLGRYKDAVAKEGAEHPDARTISLARPPFAPSSPNWLLNLGLGLVLGVIVGGAAAMLTETNFPGLTGGKDVERRLGLPYLGGVPLLKSVNPHEETPLDTIAVHPGGAFAEAVRGVLAAARQSGNSRNQVLAVTSALPDEGKTTLAACLARVAGLGGERVIVIDCDSVRASLSKHWQGSGAGLREILRDGIKYASAVQMDPVGNVAVIGITGAFSDVERLNEKDRFEGLIAELRKNFDLIVLDLPPVLPIAEARELSALADNVVFVAKWRKTKDEAIRAALKLLPIEDIAHIGVALNAVDMRKRMQVDGAEAFYGEYHKYYEGRAHGASS